MELKSYLFVAITYLIGGYAERAFGHGFTILVAMSTIIITLVQTWIHDLIWPEEEIQNEPKKTRAEMKDK